jgi:hypothetical protein
MVGWGLLAGVNEAAGTLERAVKCEVDARNRGSISQSIAVQKRHYNEVSRGMALSSVLAADV